MVVMAWVNQFPHCFDSYLTDDVQSNPYVYNPKTPQMAYVSGRSLELVSRSISKREHLSANALLADMIGTIGESAARDMHAYVDYQDQLPSWKEMTANPKTCKLPDSDGACAVLVFGAIAKVERETITPFMEYIGRMHANWQAIFALNIAKNPTKQQIAFTSTKFRDWCTENEDIL